jgi:hypothetical protein
MDLFLFAVILLAAAAIFDLMVGVSNDAANFLNSPTWTDGADLTLSNPSKLVDSSNPWF